MAKSIKDQIAEARAAAAAAALNPADAASLADLETLAVARAEQEEAEAVKRGLDLMKRLLAAQEIHGVNAVKPVAIKGSPHTFIIKENAREFSRWEARFTKSVMDKKTNKAEADRDFAIASVIDWNGETNFADTVNGYALIQHFTNNPGMVSPVVAAALAANHFIAEEAKS